MVLPKLLALLESEAPGIEIVLGRLPLDTDDALASGRVDIMVGRYAGSSPDVHRKLLFREKLRVLAHRDHEACGPNGLSLEAYLACGHVLVSPRGRPGSPVDEALAELAPIFWTTSI
jgi:DNA-binding transcriptional LysR family regulator